MNNRIESNDLKINENLFNFINNDVLSGLNISKDFFWEAFSKIIYDLAPINYKLLKKREVIQAQINEWHKLNKYKDFNLNQYKNFLKKIEYIVEEGGNFQIETKNVDPEIATICGPQLVVPITNARYALNAVNSRWGSLYDAVYGTDILGKLPDSNEYNKERGEKVINYAKSYLDKIFPLEKQSWKNIVEIRLEEKKLKFFLDKENFVTLKYPKQIIGFKINSHQKLNEVVLIKNNLHCRILIDPNNKIGREDVANISDIILESAISTILDCEDSVATVDGYDKILAYRNWLGLMKGDLQSEFLKNSEFEI